VPCRDRRRTGAVAVTCASSHAPEDRRGRAPRLGFLMSLFQRILHAGEGRKLKLLESIVPEVGSYEPDMERRSDDELRALTVEFRGLLCRAETREKRVEMLDDLLPEAFAAAREAARRTLGQ